MSDTTLNATESGMLADIRLHDIVVGRRRFRRILRRITLGAERGIAYRPAGQCVFAWSLWDRARNRKMKSSGPKSAMRSRNGFATGFPKLRRA